jgi:cytochrome c-type biogenesis protein CcmE
MSTAAQAGPDTKSAWKIVATVVVAVLGVGSLLYASTGDDVQYYKMVDEVMSNPAPWKDKRLRVHGYVAQDSIEQKKGTLEYRFRLETKAPRAPHVVEVSYKGLVPDTFKSGAETVVNGRLTADNRLVAESIEAKCPSKYEPKEGGQGAALLTGENGAAKPK